MWERFLKWFPKDQFEKKKLRQNFVWTTQILCRSANMIEFLGTNSWRFSVFG
jgi:hypothetical protein